MFVIFLLLVTPFLYLLKHWYKNRRIYELAAKVPSSNYELPLIGVAHKFIAVSSGGLYEILKDFSYQCNEKGGIIKMCFGPGVYFMLTKAEDVDFLLKHQLEKVKEYDILRGVIGHSTLNAPVHTWKLHRKILMSAFTSKMIESYLPTFTAKSKKLVENLEKELHGGDFELFPYISTYELAIVCDTTYGVEVNCQEDPNHPFLMDVEKMMGILSERIFSILLRSDSIFKLMPQFQTYNKTRDSLYQFILMIVRTKTEELNAKREKGNLIDPSTSKIPSFLELVLTMEEDTGYTELELVQELLALTMAGTDTSALSLCFIFELLSKYPDVQEKIYQELKEVFGDTDRPLEKEDFPKLQYMERVIKESMRLYGATGLIGRQVEKEITLPSGYILPAGCGALISLFGVHRNPEYWGPNPDEFEPDRFLPERLNLTNPCCYLPFSYGPRNCPGYHFGNMTIKIAIADVIRKFRVIAKPEKTTTPNLKAKFEVLVKPLHGVKVSLERRN